jgi:chromosome partitioning protein
MAQVIAIINQKGGVGKTTTVINLAAYLVKLNQRVLVVDTDPQGNATSGLGVNKQALTITTKELMLGINSLDQAILHVESDIKLIPTNQNLATLELELAPLEKREFRLQQALQYSNYNYIIIDCPPSLSLLTVNALSAANSVIIPVQAEYYALEGISQLLEVVQLVKNGLNPNLDLLGVLITMYDSRTSLSEQVKAELVSYFGAKVFKTVIPRNVRLAEAPSHGKTIATYDKWSKGAKAYKQLAKEVEHRSALS